MVVAFLPEGRANYLRPFGRSDCSQLMRSEGKKEYSMKRKLGSMISSRTQKIACTVSAAALMLGVSSAATVGLHFQDSYCASAPYTGFVVTMTAFGIPTNGWQNLAQMDTGYGCTPGMVIYTLNQIISTN